MLTRLILKNFRSNLKNYFLFFTSNVIAVAELFVFWGLNDIVKKAVTDRVTAEALKFDFQVAAGLMVFLTVFLMIYAMQYYVRLRIKDYSMLVVLGLRKKSSVLLLLVEYCSGCLLSLAAGMAGGFALFYGVQKGLKHLNPEFLTIQGVRPEICRNVCLLALLLMAVVFVGLTVWMEDRDLGQLMGKADRVEKRPSGKLWVLPVLAGAGLVAFSLYYYQKSDTGYVYSHVFQVAGLFLLVYFGLSLVLEYLRGRKGFYLGHILKLNQLYSHYQNSLLVLLMLLVIHFFALTYLAVEISAVLPLDKYRENYPWDAVWMCREEDQAFTEKLEKQYGAKVLSCPIVRMTTEYGAMHIGLSASSYEKLGGKKVELEGREILAGIEDQDFTEETTIQDETYWDVYRYLHTGEKEMDPYELFVEDPECVYDLQGVITESVIGQYSIDRWHENLIVMSQECFQEQQEKIRDNPREPVVLNLITFPRGEKETAQKELKDYGKNQTVYLTDEFLHGQEMRLLFSLLSKVFLLGALFVSGFFITGIRTLAELGSYRRRYEFLDCMGMKKKEQYRLLRFETAMLSRIALGACLVMAVFYLGIWRYKLEKNAGAPEPEFWFFWAGILLAYILADALVQRLFAWYIRKRLEKGGNT